MPDNIRAALAGMTDEELAAHCGHCAAVVTRVARVPDPAHLSARMVDQVL